ncbi:MAG: DNA-directed RNA polymerase subunit omega, partial [Defluviitaleaceae bacterium]|nr:DNA-directed RNA polymerase subunit omega [Defluviitaleaceae bacterium]
MEVIKQGERLDSRVTSRYTVVLAAAKRARQLTDGANPLTYAPT